MAKAKRKHLDTLASKRENLSVNNNDTTLLPSEETDLLSEENSWIEVKKQKIIILIPSLPSTKEGNTKQIESSQKTHAKSIGRVSAKRKRTTLVDFSGFGKPHKNERKLHMEMKTQNDNIYEDSVMENRRTPTVDLPKHTAAASLQAVEPASCEPTKLLPPENEKLQAAEREPISTRVCEPAELDLSNFDRDINSVLPEKASKKSSQYPQQIDYYKSKSLEGKLRLNDLKMQIHKMKKSFKECQHPPSNNGRLQIPENDSLHHKQSILVGRGKLVPATSSRLMHFNTSISTKKDSTAQHLRHTHQRVPPRSNGAMISLHPATFNNPEQHCESSKNTGLLPGQCMTYDQTNSSKLVARKRSHSNNMQINDKAYCKNARREARIHASDNYMNTMALKMEEKRVMLLKKKLDNVGGLSNWLVSQGLGRFIDMFHKENILDLDLLGLDMTALREMGEHAVGPRRKLLYAIDQLSQPYCFRAF